MKLIFHTAQCGSSLLVSLLGTSNLHTYSEPSWTHAFIENNRVPDYIPSEKEVEDFVVKLPSGLCRLAPLTDKPKVFLYRELRDHIYRHLIKSCEFTGEGNWGDTPYYWKYANENRHPSLKKINPETNIQKLTFYWLNNVMWITESKNVRWVHSDTLFLNLKETTNEICEHLNIPPVTNFNLALYDVKRAGLKGRDIPLQEVDIRIENLYRRNIEQAVVNRPFRDSCKKVHETFNWAISQLDEKTLGKLNNLL